MIEHAETRDTAPKSSHPERYRAVFAQEDFQLIRAAIGHYLKEVPDSPEAVKYSNLFHRLGRVV